MQLSTSTDIINLLHMPRASPSRTCEISSDAVGNTTHNRQKASRTLRMRTKKGKYPSENITIPKMALYTGILFLSILSLRAHGVDYLVAFPRDGISTLMAQTGKNGVQVTLKFPGNGSSMNLSANTDDISDERFFEIPASWMTDEGVENKAVVVHVPENTSASIYGFGGLHVMFTPLPVAKLGTYHTVHGCSRHGTISLVIATLNKTKIEITLALDEGTLVYDGNTFKTGDRLKFQLANYQTLTLKCNCSFAQTEVKSSVSVAVFLWSGNFMQIFPWKLAGSEFIIDAVNKYYPLDILLISTLKDAELQMNNGTKVHLSAGLNHILTSTDHVLYFNTSMPCIATKCSGNDYLPSNVLPSSLYTARCYLPSCRGKYGPPDILIMTDERSDVQVNDADQIDWTPILSTAFKVGLVRNSITIISSNSTFTVMFTCPASTPWFTNCGYSFVNPDVIAANIDIRLFKEEEQSKDIFERDLFYLNVYLFAFPKAQDPSILASTWKSPGSLEVQLRSGYQVNVTMRPHQSRNILLSKSIISDGINNGSFLARVSHQAAVYGDNNFYTSGFAPLPIKALGKEYTIVICEVHGTSSITIATHFYPARVSIHFVIDNENGSVTFQGKQYKNGDTLMQILVRFQTLTFSSSLIITGTLIRSNQTVAVFKEDQSFLQLLPNELANTEFIVSKLDYHQSPLTGNELSVTSFYDHTTIRYGQKEYEVCRKGTFKSQFSFFEVLHIKSDKPILVHTCSFQAYQDVVPPISLFPSECVLPVCLPLDKPQYVIILSDNNTDVDVSDAYVRWRDIEGSDFKRGSAIVASDRPVHLSSSSKFNVLAACPMTPFFTYCGYNVTNINFPPVDDTKRTDHNLPTLTEDLDNAYLIAFPTIEGINCQPAVEVYTSSSAGVIHVNTSRGVSASVRVQSHSYDNITRREWWSKEGIDSGALIIRKLVGSQINIYGGCHRYSYEKTFQRDAKKSFAPIPMSALGNKYTIVVCGVYQRAFSVAAYINSTSVSIKFVLKNLNESIQFLNRTYKSGDVLVKYLQKFQTLTFHSDFDITGTTITSLEPVGVFYHSDNLIQILPDHLAGEEFVISKITDVRTRYHRYNVLITSEHNNYNITFADETYIIKKKGTIHREYLLHEGIHFQTTKPVSIHTCTFNNVLDVIPPVNILPSQCILPMCFSYETPESILILSNSTTDVDFTNGKFVWQDISKSNFRIGTAEVKSRVPVSITSENRFFILAACPLSPYVTTCGFNISITDENKQHDSMSESSPARHFSSDKNTSYLLAFPVTRVELEEKPLVEMYNNDKENGGMALLIQTNGNFDIISHNYSYYSISNREWWCREGVENKSIIITEIGDNDVILYAGFHSYSIYSGFQQLGSTLTPLVPINALGREYTVVVCEFISRYPVAMTIATHSFTADVTINFVFAEKGIVIFNRTEYRNGDKLECHLEEYQTLTIIVAHDITGTRINSSETVGVFLLSRNFVQLFPDILADKEFVVSKFNYSDTDSSKLFITSVYDNTDVIFPNNRINIQTKGTIHHDFLSKDTPYFTTTKPVLVHMCYFLYYFDVVPPTSMFLSKCTLPLCVPSIKPEDIMVLSHNTTLVNVSDAKVRWTEIKDCNYKVGRTQVKTSQPVRVTSPSRFIALSACPLSPFFTYCGFNISMSHFPVLVNQSAEDTDIFVDDKPVWKTSETEMIAITVTFLVLLLVLIAALPYCLWKRRAVFIMKLVYRFQAYEDNDDREFDAFISYRSTEEDEHFVVHTLFPKLEKELNFKVCVHFRDFMPGETIANNIIEAIEKSRRTILVMSPAYVRSEFCRFEYQRAQHEMLKQKQRIIPIIFKNITDATPYMDDTLRTILNSITYLEWPGDNDEKKLKQFWEKLLLAMPKVLRQKFNVTTNIQDIRENGDVISVDTEVDNRHGDVTHNNDAFDADSIEF